MATRDTPRTTGTVPERVRRIPDDPTTEVVVSVARFEIKDDDTYKAYSAAGHCGKPSNGKCLYCSNHYAAHENDPTTRIVRQYIDNRGANGNKGRQNVILCAHVDAPTANTTPTPATHTQTTNATTNATSQKGKDSIMSTATNANVNLDAITAQIAALNAALAALSTPTAPAPAPTPTAPAPATTAPATPNTAKKPVIINFGGGLTGTFTANAANFATGNTGWRGQVKAEDENGDKYQITFMASKVGGNPNKPVTVKK